MNCCSCTGGFRGEGHWRKEGAVGQTLVRGDVSSEDGSGGGRRNFVEIECFVCIVC